MEGVVTETEEARLIDFGDKEVWIPKSCSQVDDDDTIQVEDWFIVKNNLEDYAK